MFLDNKYKLTFCNLKLVFTLLLKINIYLLLSFEIYLWNPKILD